MAFEDDRDYVTGKLQELGIEYTVDEQKHKIFANGYVLSYTNGYYGKEGEDKSLGRGQQEFLKLVQSATKEK